MLPKEYGSGSTCHRRFQKWNRLDIFKKVWIKLLKIYDDCIGINWTWQQSIDKISCIIGAIGKTSKKLTYLDCNQQIKM